MAVFRGQNVRIDYSDLELTEELEEALGALDDECRDGCGGTWEIFEEDGTWRAVFLDMATDELVWDADEGSWTDDYGDEDEDEDDEEYMAAFVA
jgi:hypothetical protein